MWESFKIWLNDHWVETATWTVVIAVLLWLTSLLFGCAAIPVDVDFEQIAERVAAIAVESTSTVTATSGGVVNEPWTARILAVGLVLGVVALSFLAYFLVHRLPAVRRAIDKVKGKPC